MLTISWFNKITSTLKYKNVPHEAIGLMLFPFSLEGAARIWLEKEPPRSILTWEDLVSNEAWDSFKDLLRKCPHHGFLELHQIDMFYNALTQSDQDSLNAAAGDSSTSGNPTPSDPIIASSSPSLTPFEGGDFILEEIETFLRTPDELSNLDDDYYDTEGYILYLEKLLNEDPSPNLPPMKNGDLKQVDVTMTKPSIEEPPELELKDLPSHLEYAFLEGTDKLPVNDATRKDHFPLPFMDQMLERLARNEYYCFLDGFPDIFKCLLTRKTKIRPPLLTLIGRLPTDICLLVYVMLRARSKGHKISKSGIEVDKAKVDVIAKLHHPTSVKGVQRAKNLAADHLSRLENPHQGDLEKKEINETFPLETLGMISFHSDSSTPWFADIANYHAGNFVVKRMSSQQKKSSLRMLGIIFGTTPTCLGLVRIK
ncbi:hypothetical protein Tco_0900738 [Tanacetum coccineum]